ncbi:MAG: hypothetical protein IJU98_10540 [Synergistaceae bacterium]|nr:hypothetical protein [Synergistaceae bacterium]
MSVAVDSMQEAKSLLSRILFEYAYELNEFAYSTGERVTDCDNWGEVMQFLDKFRAWYEQSDFWCNLGRVYDETPESAGSFVPSLADSVFSWE